MYAHTIVSVTGCVCVWIQKTEREREEKEKLRMRNNKRFGCVSHHWTTEKCMVMSREKFNNKRHGNWNERYAYMNTNDGRGRDRVVAMDDTDRFEETHCTVGRERAIRSTTFIHRPRHCCHHRLLLLSEHNLRNKKIRGKGKVYTNTRSPSVTTEGWRRMKPMIPSS